MKEEGWGRELVEFHLQSKRKLDSMLHEEWVYFGDANHRAKCELQQGFEILFEI